MSGEWLDEELIALDQSLILPPPRLKISDWANAEAEIPTEGNAEPGKYLLSRMPHQQAMLDDPQDSTVREIFWMMASQAAGKTLCLILICEFVISQLHKSLIMVRDTSERALGWIRDKFLPTVEATDCMKGLLIDPRKRDSGSTSISRRFPGGVFKVIGAKSRGAFRSTSCGIVLQDEIDAYETIKEGDPCALADRAAITFTDAWKIKSSTPTLEGFSRIQTGYLRGDQQKYFLPCVHCGHFQHLRWEQLKFSFTKEEHESLKGSSINQSFGNEISLADKSISGINEESENKGITYSIGSFPIIDTKAAIYVCEACQKGWTDTDRIKAYMSGHHDNDPVIVNGKELRAEWRSTAPFKGIRSRHLNGLYLTIGLEKNYDNYLQQFAENFLIAKRGGRETLMAWTNMFKCEVFSEPGETVDWKGLIDRAEDYGPELPVEVLRITFGADVHPDRVEILFYGWGDAQECWGLERVAFYGDFDMPSMQERVEDFLTAKRFRHPMLGDLAVDCGMFDSGYQTKVRAVYKFCGRNRLKNWWASKGVDELGGAVYSRKTERRYGGLFFLLNTDYLKSTIFERLRRTEHGPRFIHYPKAMVAGEKTRFDESFYSQMCSEKRVAERQPRGGYKWKWVKLSSAMRNEALDCTVGAFAAFEVSKPDEWIARKWKELSKKLASENPPAPVEKREVILNQPAEAKIPELKVERRGAPVRPFRRRIRIASPFANQFARRY